MGGGTLPVFETILQSFILLGLFLTALLQVTAVTLNAVQKMRVLCMVDGRTHNICTLLWPTHVGSSILHTPASSWNALEEPNISRNVHNLRMNFDRVTSSPLISQQTSRKFNSTQISGGSIKSDRYARVIITAVCASLDSEALCPSARPHL
jgi:hypothetical protein